MNLTFKNKKITGMLLALPENEQFFDNEVENYNFTKSQSMKLKLVMGYNKHRLADEKTCISDMCVYAVEYLIQKNYIIRNEIDAIVLVTQSPDYLMPQTSTIIQGRLNLKKDIYCIDIVQGCSAFIVGLHQAFMLLEQQSINKVILLNADILSRKVSKKDRNSYPLVGDGAAVTLVEKSDDGSEIFACHKMDGTRADALMIPAGGFKLPCSAETAVMEEDGNGNFRSKDNLVMKGDAVFNFVMNEVPPLIDELAAFANTNKDKIDYYMFHQPNKFMLQKLADKMGVPHDKMPNNVVENFGNSSGATVPTAITFNLGEKLLTNTYNICLAGFGVGLTWSAILMQIGNLKFCEIIDYK